MYGELLQLLTGFRCVPSRSETRTAVCDTPPIQSLGARTLAALRHVHEQYHTQHPAACSFYHA